MTGACKVNRDTTHQAPDSVEPASKQLFCRENNRSPKSKGESADLPGIGLAFPSGLTTSGLATSIGTLDSSEPHNKILASGYPYLPTRKLRHFRIEVQNGIILKHLSLTVISPICKNCTLYNFQQSYADWKLLGHRCLEGPKAWHHSLTQGGQMMWKEARLLKSLGTMQWFLWVVEGWRAGHPKWSQFSRTPLHSSSPGQKRHQPQLTQTLVLKLHRPWLFSQLNRKGRVCFWDFT